MPKSPLSRSIAAWIFLALLLAGCNLPQAVPTQTPVSPTLTVTQTLTITPVPSPTGTMPPTATQIPEPAGCRKPPDDYTRLEVDGSTINGRTLAMLTHAQELYGGELEISGYAITQGSYSNAVDASFGTHAGGGAVDLSVLRRDTYTVLWDDIEPLVRALRAAGFAAWLREYGELYPDSPIHIHAIAIGDQELSPAAKDQLTGPSGYFRGYSGLPAPDGAPTADRYGGPVLCQWMIDLGYRDLR